MHRFLYIHLFLFLQILRNNIESNLERLFKTNRPKGSNLLMASRCNSSDHLSITLVTLNDIRFFNLKDS